MSFTYQPKCETVATEKPELHLQKDLALRLLEYSSCLSDDYVLVNRKYILYQHEITKIAS